MLSLILWTLFLSNNVASSQSSLPIPVTYSEIRDHILSSNLPINATLFYPILNQVSEHLRNLSPIDNQNGNECAIDLLNFAASLKNVKSNPWTLKVIDSFGKPRSGILKGNSLWLGNYEECIGIHESKFTGKYCGAVISTPTAIPIAIPGAQFVGKIYYGLCVPSSCSANFLANSLRPEFNALFSKYGLNFEGVYCPAKETDLPIATTFATVVSSVLGLLVVAAFSVSFLSIRIRNLVPLSHPSSETESFTTDDVTMNNESDFDDKEPILPSTESRGCCSWLGDILACFSPLDNARKILATSSAKNDLAAVHGIRFLSMAWVILGHTYYFGFPVLQNPVDVYDPNQHGFWYQAVIQAVFSVDTFFLLSGCLLSYNFILFTLQNPEQLHSPRFWLSFYLHRLWRLTPTYMSILCVYIGLSKFAGDGPLWPKGGFEYNDCEDSWWTNLLYVNNLVEIYINGTETRQYCMGWTWYLANDMQFFIISPIFLYPLARGFASLTTGFRPKTWRIIAGVLLVLASIASMTATGVISVAHDLPANMFPPDLSHVATKFRLEYLKPWCRIVPFLIGLALGVLLVSGLRLSKIINFLGWTVSATVCVFVIFGLWPQYRGTVYTKQDAAFYAAGSRLGWALGVSWVIYACTIKNGGPVNTLLSSKLLVPLSRLTYTAYLVHPIIMMCYYYNIRETIYYTDATMVWLFAGFLTIAYAAAFVVSIVFEAPFLALDKLIFKDRKKAVRN